MITLTAENFTEQVLESDKPVLVDFWAEWCGPCKMIAPVLEEIETEYGDRVTIAKLNADEYPEITAKYGVLGLPTLNLYKGGEVVQQIKGAKPKRQLLADLEGHI
jgi:thioredoxin 1